MRVDVDAGNGLIDGEIEISATPEAVFRALTDPAQLEQWWGSDAMYRTYGWTSDLRPGGARHCYARGAGGDVSEVRGTYVTVDPPRVLEHTWEPSWEGFASTLVRFELQPTAGGTRLRITHSGFGANSPSAEGHGEGWKRVLGWLGEYVSAREGAAAPA